MGALNVSQENIISARKQYLLLESDKIDPQTINRLGGTVKIGQIIDAYPKNAPHKLSFALSGLLPTGEKRISFGFSNYSGAPIREKQLGMELKKMITESGQSARWVMSKEKVLSSVVVEENRLTGPGIEFCFFPGQDQLLIGQTLAVQPYKDLSFRDYERPARDDHSGMIPPKLAMIMLNLSGARFGEKIIDPFCGSGTIVNEALLLGYSKVYGTDLSQKAVRDSLENFTWLKNRYPKLKDPKLQNLNVLNLSEQFSPATFQAVVTEPFLGPPRGKRDFNAIKKELERLYTLAFQQFSQILKDNGRIVMVWPVFQAGSKPLALEPELKDFKIYNLSHLLPAGIAPDTKRGTIIYGRPGQNVWREIVILEKS